ncbi:MAG: LPS export ABC transporter periplasmic protein LptC [Treponema sp.]|nr:LPS export ABC transporter periplasmic protein LptC [Treponema sp.]
MKYLYICFLASIFFHGCSLKYTQGTEGVEERIPEFVFENPTFIRYEDNVKTVFLNAATVEQYKADRNTYAKNVNFFVNDEDGNIATEGECALLALDSKKGEYSLYDNININHKKDNISMHATELRWNEKTEQLISGRGNNITVTQDGTTIHGSGFSASGVTNSFQFVGAVSGVIETNDENENNE